MLDFNSLEKKSKWVWNKTLELHGRSAETRIASSLSCIEILITLFYTQLIQYDPKNPLWEERDRLIISKGHGSISFYPILADLGFISVNELEIISKADGILKSIPDNFIPGYESINGSLAHGLNVGCGVALSLKKRNQSNKVFVLYGDGELYEGSTWEAIMFAAHHQLDNLYLIVDKNGACMLDFCKNVIDLDPLADKFTAFNWIVEEAEGHDFQSLHQSFEKLVSDKRKRPKVLIANTIKGKGISELEKDPLSHIKSLSQEKLHQLIMK